ncbi:hypothetical protein FQZ97_984200 [compost metagenome]
MTPAAAAAAVTTSPAASPPRVLIILTLCPNRARLRAALKPPPPASSNQVPGLLEPGAVVPLMRPRLSICAPPKTAISPSVMNVPLLSLRRIGSRPFIGLQRAERCRKTYAAKREHESNTIRITNIFQCLAPPLQNRNKTCTKTPVAASLPR